ncbi:Uncharacterised protein [Vibrio cholerae]|nr:Uncharacterised protein [Vibrio cholerae]
MIHQPLLQLFFTQSHLCQLIELLLEPCDQFRVFDVATQLIIPCQIRNRPFGEMFLPAFKISRGHPVAL